jgi:hypothetical protein
MGHYKMLNKLEKRLRNTGETIRVSDLLRIVDHVGIFNSDAIAHEGRRLITKRIQVIYEKKSFVVEETLLERVDEDGKRTTDCTELIVDGKRIEITLKGLDAKFPVCGALKHIVGDFLKNKDLYSGVYANLGELAGIQEELYVAEKLRESVQNAMTNRMATGGYHD